MDIHSASLCSAESALLCTMVMRMQEVDRERQIDPEGRGSGDLPLGGVGLDK